MVGNPIRSSGEGGGHVQGSTCRVSQGTTGLFTADKGDRVDAYAVVL